MYHSRHTPRDMSVIRGENNLAQMHRLISVLNSNYHSIFHLNLTAYMRNLNPICQNKPPTFKELYLIKLALGQCIMY